MISILYVCHANMCRSPSLQGFLQKWINKHGKAAFYYVDSCGLTPGLVIDRNTFEAAAKKGVYLSHTPRALEFSDFFTFDYILAATEEIRQILLFQGAAVKERIYLATYFSELYPNMDLPDPYCSNGEGCDKLMEIIEESTFTFFNYLEQRHFS